MTGVTPPQTDGANLLNLCLEENPCPVPDTSNVMLDNFLTFSMFNDGVMIIDEKVTPNNGVVDINAEEKIDEDWLLFYNESTQHIFIRRSG